MAWMHHIVRILLSHSTLWGVSEGLTMNVAPTAGVDVSMAGKLLAGDRAATIDILRKSKRYLVATFPNMKQVAYLHLPDTVWRPLVIGEVQFPKALANDPQHSRVFVSDQPQNKVFWYNVHIDPEGYLMTDGIQHVAVEGFEVYWMSVNGVGDLYFTGKQAVQPPQSSYEAVFRVDLEMINAGESLNPVEVYSRPNSGNPNPKVWMPSGIAVDSFFIYWGNQERGTEHGSVVKGSRQNIGNGAPQILTTLSSQSNEVRGMAATGTLLYYLTPEGVWGIPKTGSVASLISPPPKETAEGTPWDPRSVAWDGFGTMYFTDNVAGRIYSIPAQDTLPHDIQRFADAPGVHGVTVFEYREPLELNSYRHHSAAVTCAIPYATLVFVFCNYL